MKNINIAIADDEALFRKGMKLILEGNEGIEVVVEAENGEDLIDQLKSTEVMPEIVLLDLKMPKMNGIEAAKVLHTDFPDIKIIVVSTHYSRAFIINMIELSAVAYLPKNSQPSEVIETILAVSDKGFYYNSEVLSIIRENIITRKKVEAQFMMKLTQREKEILQLICEQYTASEIAKKLFISPRTVDGHRNNLLVKLDCKNVAGLVVVAMQQQLVKIPFRY